MALEPHPLSYDKHLCASKDGFTLHAATRAGALDDAGREALLRYVLRPPIAQERIEPQKIGLVRIALNAPMPTKPSPSTWSSACPVSLSGLVVAPTIDLAARV